jgi:regulator of nucleoside diphosphate kinase
MEVAMEPINIILSDMDYNRLSKFENNSLLKNELNRADVVPADQVPPNVVGMNSRVTYLDENNGISREIELVYPEEADWKDGKISVLAPVGLALLGLSVDQRIVWPFPDNRYRRLKVLSVAV